MSRPIIRSGHPLPHQTLNRYGFPLAPTYWAWSLLINLDKITLQTIDGKSTSSLQDAFLKEEAQCRIPRKLLSGGHLWYLSVHMSAWLLMIVPYMLVRKPLATPRELAHKRPTLLMDCLNMLVQIGFLQFQVHQEWITVFFLINLMQTNHKCQIVLRLETTPLKMNICSPRSGI